MAFKRVTCQAFGATRRPKGRWVVAVKGTLEFAGDNEVMSVIAKDEDEACRKALAEYTEKRERAQGVPG